MLYDKLNDNSTTNRMNHKSICGYCFNCISLLNKKFIMKTTEEFMQEIIQVSSHIETNYPELYKYLGETPINNAAPKIESEANENLSKYLETLKSLMQHYIETNKI